MTRTAVKSKAAVQLDHDPAYAERVVAEKRRLIEAGVQYCFATWVDVTGRSKAKFVPIERFDHLAHGSEMYTAQAFEVMGPLGPQDDDQAALPDLDSLVICPWDRRYAWMASDLYWHGERYEYCSRSILKNAVGKAAKSGYAMMLGIEPEFYILRRDGQNGTKPFHANDVGPCWGYDVESTLDAMPILSVLQKYLDELEWEVSSFDHEGGHSQYEFDFGYTDVVDMCDRFVFMRLMLKEVAKTFGAFVTFMPKPFPNDFRSGAHLNMSIVDEHGNRCAETGTLEFDHLDGFARTRLHRADRIRLLCRAHNQHAAERMYGRAFMERARASAGRDATTPGIPSG